VRAQTITALTPRLRRHCYALLRIGGKLNLNPIILFLFILFIYFHSPCLRWVSFIIAEAIFLWLNPNYFIFFKFFPKLQQKIETKVKLSLHIRKAPCRCLKSKAQTRERRTYDCLLNFLKTKKNLSIFCFF